MWLLEKWLLYSVICTHIASPALGKWKKDDVNSFFAVTYFCVFIIPKTVMYFLSSLSLISLFVFCHFSCCNQINVISLHVIQLSPHSTRRVLTSRDSRRRRGQKRTACTRPPSGRTWACHRSSRMPGRRAAPSCPSENGSTYHRGQRPHRG